MVRTPIKNVCLPVSRKAARKQLIAFVAASWLMASSHRHGRGPTGHTAQLSTPPAFPLRSPLASPSTTAVHAQQRRRRCHTTFSPEKLCDRRGPRRWQERKRARFKLVKSFADARACCLFTRIFRVPYTHICIHILIVFGFITSRVVFLCCRQRWRRRRRRRRGVF